MPERILVVDDDADTLRLVSLMLERQGYQVHTASGGKNALAAAQSEKPDLIIMDVMMPDMDGYTVTRRLRANPETAHIPLIFFTAKSQVDDKVAGFDLGADDYLTKPTQPRELFAHVKAVLNRSRKGRAEAASPAGEKGHVIGILAAKGGLGVSTLAVNLGAALRSRAKKEVVVAEFRPGEGSLALDLGLTAHNGLVRLLQMPGAEITSTDVENELHALPSGLRLLSASYDPQDVCHNQAVEAFEGITRHLAYMAHFILLDLGPGLLPKTEALFKYCDSLVVILEPVPNTVIRTKMLLERLRELGFNEGRTNLVLNSRVRSEMQLSWTQVQEQVGQQLAVTFTPAPEAVYQAARNNVPLVVQQPDGVATQQFSKLADAVARMAHLKVTG